MCALVDAWLTDADLPADEHVDAPPPPPPQDCEPVRCWYESAPFLRMLDERAIDFPVSVDAFRGGPPIADLWVRPVQETPTSGLATQLIDVLILDGHLMDAAQRAHPTLVIDGVSLDLSIVWSAVVAGDVWRRVRCLAAGPGRGLTSVRGTVSGADGTTIARATQLGLIRA